VPAHATSGVRRWFRLHWHRPPSDSQKSLPPNHAPLALVTSPKPPPAPSCRTRGTGAAR
jgi:hypothetical protein